MSIRRILLATGIYPPDIGGPATYVEALAREFSQRGAEVIVLAYGRQIGQEGQIGQSEQSGFSVFHVSKSGGPLARWNRYAKALKKHGADADVVYAFSTVSVGVPLMLAKLKKPKKILRLGGDFLWERYTGGGGKRSLRTFYTIYRGGRRIIAMILRHFDRLVFSTEFQMKLYERVYKNMPARSVIENALPAGEPLLHARHDPFRLLFLGRFVGFKNLPRLIQAVALVPHVHLTLVGEGPLRRKLEQQVAKLSLGGRVTFQPPVHGEEKAEIVAEHDLLVLPSLTEISPNAALEARVAGLPVLLTEETGLSAELTDGMLVRPLRTATDITRAVLEAEQNYEKFAAEAAAPFAKRRGWGEVAEETMGLLQQTQQSVFGI